jgi:histidine triad (HIT) family protein
MNCIICDKHKDFASSVGESLAIKNGVVIAHIPVIDDQPATRGHLLIEPLRHVTEASELTEDEAMALGLFIRNGIKLVTKELGAEHAYVFRINDKVPHFHVHIVPRYSGTPAEYWGTKIMDWKGSPKLGGEEIKALSFQLKKSW